MHNASVKHDIMCLSMKKKRVVIIGAGPGGLASAMLLAHRGYNVEVFEKNPTPGGRNGALHLSEYAFDIGPTFFMMDSVLRSIFAQTGRSLDDCVSLTRLAPMYRLFFDHEHLDVYEDQSRMKEELKRVFPGEEKGLEKFYQKEAKRLEHLYPILRHDNNHILDALRYRFLRALPSFSLGRTLYDVMGDYFKSPFCRLSFTFQSKYLGMSPWVCPGAFAMVPFVEHSAGIFHAKGGLSAVAEAMARVVEEEGGKIHYATPVKEILVENHVAKGVLLENGEKIMADDVIVNADFSYAATHLFPAGTLKKYSPDRLEKKRYSCSTLLFYFGVDATYPVEHHNIVFAEKYRENVDDIFAGRFSPKDFSFYVRDATRTDPTLAPKGKSALYVLIPVPNNRADLDWKALIPDIRAQVLSRMENVLGMKGIASAIEQEKVISPEDWESDYAVHLGAVFNLSHDLGQMLWFRPHNACEGVKHCFLVGGGTHPGSGLPTIYESGRIAANLIAR